MVMGASAGIVAAREPESKTGSPPGGPSRRDDVSVAETAAARPNPQDPVVPATENGGSSWETLDRRPNPPWFDDDKFGIFIHWSVFSVPAVAWVYPDKRYGHGGHSCWYGLYVDRIRPLRDPAEQARFEAFHRETYGDVPFKALAPLFKAEAFDARRWAAIFKRSGARYAFLTSNFHDGYCLWPSPYAPGWNSMEVGPKRDVMGEFSSAMREAGLRAGFYYSLGEFNHPLYLAARKTGGDLGPFVRDHMQPQLREAVVRYRPSFIYFDGEWEFPLDVFGMRSFLAWLYGESPCANDVVVNDRFGKGSRGVHGGVFSSEAGVLESGTGHKWCEDRPISRGNWSYNRLERLEDYLGERDMVHLLVETVAQGGNLHLDVSPCSDGTIPMLQQERLAQMGDWLKVNGEAIYGTRRWVATHEGPMVESRNPRLDKDWKWIEAGERPLVHYTRKDDAVYAICLAWPGEKLRLARVGLGRNAKVEMLGYPEPLTWRPVGESLEIDMPRLAPGQLPCRNAWALKLSGARCEGDRR
jgi:alpha-L-fucosidase